MRAPLISFSVSLFALLVWFAVEGRYFYVGGVSADDVRMWAVLVSVGALFASFLVLAVIASRREQPDAMVVPILAMVLLVPFGGLSDVGAVLARAEYTVIEGDTHGRYLVAREWALLFAGNIDVYEGHGFWLTKVGSIGGDDGYLPISAGAYRLHPDSDAVVIQTPFSYDQPINHELVLPDSGPTHPWGEYSQCIPGACIDP